MEDGNYAKAFGSVEVRKQGANLIVGENSRLLPRRIAGHLLVVLVAGSATLFFWLYRGPDSSVVTGALQLLGLLLAAICVIALVSLIQMLVFARFPIVIDRAAKQVTRGSRVHLEGKFKAAMKRLSGKQEQNAFHVRLVQKDKAIFLWRANNETDAQEMVNVINLYLKPSLANAEVGEDSFDHVG